MSTTYRRSKNALAKLRELLSKPALFIHYSCESFYDYTIPASRRITSIAVRVGNSSQTHSFSLHLSAEKLGHLADIAQHLDDCERAMLGEFYDFVQTHRHAYNWLHWNMRDANYGFEALDHRFAVLGGTAIEIADANKTDLSPLLIDIYGKNYTGHPRMVWLINQNKIHDRALLTGEEEAVAFEEGRFVALHQSTLLKVQAIAEIADLASRRKLKTQSRWRDVYGASFADFGDALKDNWIWVIGTSLIGLILGALPFLIGS
jgi:hypothetical protein